MTGRGYEMFDWAGPYTEVVTPGAFEKSLSRADLDVPLVLAHDSLRRIARTTNGSLTLTEDDQGLACDAPNLDPNDADVAYIAPKLRSGLVDEMSFRFQITAGEWSPDWTEYHINEVDIHRGDVAIVGYGANPYTTEQLRSAISKVQLKRSLGSGDAAVIQQALGAFLSIDAIADELVEALTAYTQAPSLNPDDVAELAEATIAQMRERHDRLEAAMRLRGAHGMSFADLLKV